MKLDVTIWDESVYLPLEDGHDEIGHGACSNSNITNSSTNSNTTSSSKTSTNNHDCLWRHRNRQRYFIKKCMAEYKARNRTWVLLIDVDEYITFKNNHYSNNNSNSTDRRDIIDDPTVTFD